MSCKLPQCCFIPIPGPIGPTGSMNIPAFINVANIGMQIVSTPGNTGLNFISFDQPIVSSQLTLVNNNTIVLPIAGIYEATYIVVSSTSNEGPTSLTFGLLQTSNGNSFVIPASVSMNYFNFNIQGSYYSTPGQAKFTANAGDAIQLFNNSNTPAVLPAPFTTYVNIVNAVTFGNISVPSLSAVISSKPSGFTDGFFACVSFLTTNSPVVNVTDSHSNVYTFIGNSINGNIETQIWYTTFTTPQTNVTVTATFTPAATAATMEVVNINNFSTIGATNGTTGSSTSITNTIVSSNNFSFGLMSAVAATNQLISPVIPSQLENRIIATDGTNFISSASLINYLFKPNRESINATIPTPANWSSFMVELNPPNDSASWYPNVNANLDIKLLSTL